MGDKEKEEEKGSFKVTDRRGQEKEDKDDPTTQTQAIPEESTPSSKTEPSSQEEREYQPINFSSFVYSMTTAALVHMGLAKDPHTQKTQKNLTQARQEIDLIEMLQEKTKGNLTPDEKNLIENALYELRLRFVEASK